ncbi:MAG: PPOX class F420-dependent oxidoreductase [bacterium]|nr:PPOX class F420-dependent oxidoreductase [bacterium]
MDPAQALDYIRENTNAVLATLRQDGTPQMSPVTLAVVDDTVVMSTRETAYKTKNLRRDPRSWLCAFPRNFFGDWVQIECQAVIISGPDAIDPLVEYYRTLRGEHPDWDEYRQAMVTDQRCLVRFHILHAGPDRSG